MKGQSNGFGELLKKLRRENNLTQEDLSKVINADRSSIANYERGERLPPIDSLIAIANYFNVSLDFLVLGKIDRKRTFPKNLDDLGRTLMAENTVLMEAQLKLSSTIEDLQKEISVLREYLISLEKYNQLLKSKLNSNEN